ncbi:trypsin-like peptidase domain-containing protein [Dactylosporangium aurantiacum]|uniref:Trypsin-like peptidase domain-containing protein n=1 Tax=Dactylosporangium aurantiacum TaxID=35754 RepID=A0A9Q9MM03_9ACTN|nr:serine protease [Dactylosporangium aurantiacum]MDG6103039.1 trypsin-like peptidase domain-containing protein [Dactylosporangium aurantiacum]UWZ57551.1 trypsin-like peptidase domain-containing protein [Dactylosporangium aurantiacum]
MDGRRVVQVRVTHDGGVRFGSGYRVTAGTVLTCAHLLAGAATVEVVQDGDAAGGAPARVAWRDDAADVALLGVDPGDPGEPGLAPCGFARLPDGHAVVEVTAAGYPRWKLRRDAGGTYRDLHVATGRVSTLANRRSGRLELTVEPPLESPDAAVSPWEGMSGAAVLAGDRVVGVVVEHHRDESARRLTAARVEPVVRGAGALLGLSGTAGLPLVSAPPVDGEPPLVEQLAGRVHAELDHELDRLGVHRPYPLPVRWRPGPDGDIAGTYRGTTTGRLVILGEPGGGKTVLALRLAHALLAERRPGAPVPVVFAVRTWDPRTTALDTWLAGALTERYPALADHRGVPGTAAQELLDRGRVLPVLDGLDELAPDLRAEAVKRLPGTGPMILTSTAEAYRTATETAGRLHRVTHITVTGVDRDELARYLPQAGTAGWAPVVARLAGEEPGAAAARDALRTPLAIGLARDVYRTGDPARLLDTAAVGGRAAVERHLVEAFLPAVYAEPLRGPALRLRRSTRPWHAEDDVELAVVGRQVRTLARLAGRSRGVIAWWHLYGAVPPAFRMLASGAAYLLAVAVGLLLAKAVQAVTGAGVDPVAPGGPLGAAAAIGAVAAVIGAVHAGRGTPGPVRTRLRFRGRTRAALVKFGLMFLLGKALLLPVKGFALLTGRLDLLALIVALSWGTGLAFAGTFALRGFVEAPADLGTVPSAPASYAASRRSLALTCAVVAASTVVAIGGVFAILRPFAVLGLMLAAFATPVRLVVAVLDTAYGRCCLVTRPYFALTGRLPWHTVDFLDDALCRGVLRQSGAVYLFRHERLRRALLDGPPVPRQDAPGPAPADRAG